MASLAYHQLKDAENSKLHLFKIDNLRSVDIKEDYKSLVNSKGEVNPHLPSTLDINVLKNMYNALKMNQEAALKSLTAERQAMIDEEMNHVRNTLRALDKRLAAKGLNYSIEQESWVDYISLLDEKTGKKHTGELRQPLITTGE